MKIAEKQVAAARSGSYDITGKLPAHELKAHLRAGRTCEHLNIRIVDQYGTLTFANVKHELQWLKIS